MSLTKNEIKFIKSLQLKKFREQHQQFVIEGEKMVCELINQSKFEIKHIYITTDFDENLIPNHIQKTNISHKELDRITGFKKANKILAVVNFNNQKDINYDENNLILMLDDVKDPGNLGTIIRTADWFGITQIIGSPNTVELYNPKVIQSSMGAIYRINYVVSDLESTLNEFKSKNLPIYGAVIDGESIYKSLMKTKCVLVMGSESHGISDKIKSLLTHQISIPKFGLTESLNVAMATGILLNEYKR